MDFNAKEALLRALKKSSDENFKKKFEIRLTEYFL